MTIHIITVMALLLGVSSYSVAGTQPPPPTVVLGPDDIPQGQIFHQDQRVVWSPQLNDNPWVDGNGRVWVQERPQEPAFVFAEDSFSLLSQPSTLVLMDANGSLVPVVDDAGRNLWAVGGGPCDVNGVYRPFNLFRRLQLATSYFVNPELPRRARVLNSYLLRDVVAARGADWVWGQITTNAAEIYAPAVSDDEDALAPVVGRCQIPRGQTVTERGTTVGIDEQYVGHDSIAMGADGTIWVTQMPGYADGTLRLLSADTDVLPDSDRFVAWDPAEPVTIIRESGTVMPDGGR